MLGQNAPRVGVALALPDHRAQPCALQAELQSSDAAEEGADGEAAHTPSTSRSSGSNSPRPRAQRSTWSISAWVDCPAATQPSGSCLAPIQMSPSSVSDSWREAAGRPLAPVGLPWSRHSNACWSTSPVFSALQQTDSDRAPPPVFRHQLPGARCRYSICRAASPAASSSVQPRPRSCRVVLRSFLTWCLLASLGSSAAERWGRRGSPLFSRWSEGCWRQAV